MTSATLDRPPRGSAPRLGPLPPAAATDPVSIALRAATLADVSAETADWIAAELLRGLGTVSGTVSGAGTVSGTASGTASAAHRIRRRAAAHRAEARRQRLLARKLSTQSAPA